jgi:acyl-CoA synthetase (AMP-forming)/AMP-acid ligase II
MADIWESHADRFPDALAQVQRGRRFTWTEFDRRADGVAAALLAAGLGRQDKVAQYLYNCPEYLESMFALYKAALVPVNTNYRYGRDELQQLWTDADVRAVVFHGAFAARCDGLRAPLDAIRLWLWVDDGSGPCPSWATPYEDAADAARGRTVAPWGRSGDDLYLLYTGGTTGRPKGVMWRQDDVVMNLESTARRPLAPVPSPETLAGRVSKPGPRALPAAPLMHGTGAFNSMSVLNQAGAIVTLQGRHFDVVELLDAIEGERVNSVALVGDAFAKPMLRALDAEPDRWDLSSLRIILSSGVIWSADTKQGLLRHAPDLIMIDSLGSSEAISAGQSTTSATSGRTATAQFRLGVNAKVLTEDGREVRPGSGERGRIALRGRTPLGYYKDPVKSATTFVTLAGERYSIPGDWAEVDADGTVRLLGRGSQCINTGGEKVYPEEVEEALKSHPDVHDAVVVGIPDDRFGEAVTALVEPEQGATIEEASLVAHVKQRLAAFKAPKRVLAVATIGRAAHGKPDYVALRAEALERLRPD